MSHYKGKSGHEMIQDSLLFGVERFTRNADKTVAKADRFLGLNPETTRKRRKERIAARSTLQKMGGWDVPLPQASDYGKSLQNLIKHGYIERKKNKKGFKTTKKGRSKIKDMEQPWFFKK